MGLPGFDSHSCDGQWSRPFVKSCTTYDIIGFLATAQWGIKLCIHKAVCFLFAMRLHLPSSFNPPSRPPPPLFPNPQSTGACKNPEAPTALSVLWSALCVAALLQCAAYLLTVHRARRQAAAGKLADGGGSRRLAELAARVNANWAVRLALAAAGLALYWFDVLTDVRHAPALLAALFVLSRVLICTGF